LHVLDTPRIRLDIETALQTTQRTDQPDVDHLCCGHLGRAELFVTAASRLSQPQWLETARRHARRVVERARDRGGLRLASTAPGRVYSPSCFQGTSGIGYELLRMARPDLVPSILLLE
jgi:lantibiotic modifying enzyme